jgi:metallo-beta-lactamase family protein
VKITSYGAAENVTGSKHLLEFDGYRLLLDCGMFQGHRLESDTKNRRLGFDPASIHGVVLSHAHIDHSGLLPMLAKGGYGGLIYTTHATRDLCAIMLLDSAHIQQRDAEWLSKKHMTFMPPLYQPEDVHAIMQRFVCFSYNVKLPLMPGLSVTFHDAGHVLGSSMVEIDYEEKDRRRKLIFSGDIGRKNMSILQDPWEPDDADVVIMEGTYGDRDHAPIQQMEEKLAGIIKETHARGGKIIVPSFALERSQELIFALKRLEMRNAIPDIPVYVDSPLTVNVTEVFRLHTDSFDSDFRKVMQEAGDPFQLRNIKYIRPVAESMKLNDLKGPAIIISAAGMCEHGRILHHLKNHCTNADNTILIIGFQAKNTLGRRIVERQPYLKIFGVKYPLNARVKVMNEFSAHAGQSELVEFGKRFAGRAERLFLVHGENGALGDLRNLLVQGGVNAEIMKEGQTVEV